MASKEGSTFFQKLYYISFSALALAGAGYLGYKIYKDHQEATKGDPKDKKNKVKKDDDDFEAEVQRRLKEKQKQRKPSDDDSNLQDRSLPHQNKERDRGRSFKNGLIKEYVAGKEAGGFSVGKGQGSGKIKLVQLLTEIKQLCGSDITLIKTECRRKRRKTTDDEEYAETIKEMNGKMETMVEKNVNFVCTRYGILRAEFDAMIDEHQDDDVKNLLNSLCAAEMYLAHLLQS